MTEEEASYEWRLLQTLTSHDENIRTEKKVFLLYH